MTQWANEFKYLFDIEPEQELNKQWLLLKSYFANHLFYKIQHISQYKVWFIFSQLCVLGLQ